MPPQPVIEDWIKLQVHVRHENSTMLLTYNFRHNSGTISETSLIELCTNFWTSHGSRIAALFVNTYSFILVEATDRSVVGGAYGSFVPTSPNIGTKVGDALPANVASCISLRTGFAGRAKRGRQFMFGFQDGDFNGSTLIGAAVIQLTQYIQAIINTVIPGTLSLTYCVASIKNLELIPINGFVLDSAADSQRRRLPGRGY